MKNSLQSKDSLFKLTMYCKPIYEEKEEIMNEGLFYLHINLFYFPTLG